MVLNDVTTPPTASAERRCRRGETLSQAIRYQIEHVIKDFDLATCVIATQDGLLMSAPESLPLPQAYTLAALGPELLAKKLPPLAAREFFEQACGQELGARVLLHAQEFWLYGQPMVMVTVGEREPDHELSSCRAILGVRRIAREFDGLSNLA